MATLPVPFKELQHTVKLWHEVLAEGYEICPQKRGSIGAVTELTYRLSMSTSSYRSVELRLSRALALGITVQGWPGIPDQQWAEEEKRRYARHDDDYVAFRNQTEPRPAPGGVTGRGGRGAARPASAPVVSSAPPGPTELSREIGGVARSATTAAPPDPALLDAEQVSVLLTPLLRRGPLTVLEIAEKFNVEVPIAFYAIKLATDRGAPIYDRSGRYHLDPAPAMGSQRGDQPTLISDENGRIRFGATGDSHLGSKYARLDCLEEYYDQVARRGIKVVLHAGNWIDGDAPFNRHDLLVHGMDPQMQYLAKHYPQRPGVETWAITGEDHEGWYSRREAVDVGRYAERVMQDNGRADWRDMGFMECFVPLVHGRTGASSKLCLMHPGGGSAYAVSYAPQKIVEGFDGGDKPSVLLIGHYHKSSYNIIRNVHTIQVGCFEDQTVFMRKQKLSAHLGAWFCELELDPETGAVVEFTGTFRNYFVRDYYNNRWSQHGDVNLAPRSPR